MKKIIKEFIVYLLYIFYAICPFINSTLTTIETATHRGEFLAMPLGITYEPIWYGIRIGIIISFLSNIKQNICLSIFSSISLTLNCYIIMEKYNQYYIGPDNLFICFILILLPQIIILSIKELMKFIIKKRKSNLINPN